MIAIRRSNNSDGERIVEIWRDAVDATHSFLKIEDRAALDELVSGFLPGAPSWLAVDGKNRPVAFMLINAGHMDALFVDPAVRGTGVGATLVRHGISLHP
jgi:putative acetyltransferase